MKLKDLIIKLMEVGFVVDDDIRIDGGVPIPIEDVFEIVREKGFILFRTKPKPEEQVVVSTTQCRVYFGQGHVEMQPPDGKVEWLGVPTRIGITNLVPGTSLRIDDGRGTGIYTYGILESIAEETDDYVTLCLRQP